MSEERIQTPHRLRWNFWLILFWPAVVALTGTAIVVSLGKGPGGFVMVNLFIALPLNFFCSNAAAKRLVLLRDPRGASSPWMFLWGPLLFFLNVAIVFGGCIAIEQIGRVAW